MKVLIATPELTGPGGVQSYVLTIAPHLERLGHEVTLYCEAEGALGSRARERGLRVVCGPQALPAEADAVYSQTTPLALLMAELYPRAARLLAVHSGDLDLHLPVGLDGVVSAAVVFHDAAGRRVRAMANPPPVVRLRQPIEYAVMTSAAEPRPRPEAVLALGNHLTGAARAALIAVCQQEGLRWQQVGIADRPELDPLPAIARADIVVGQGRSTLDAMAAGRPAWVSGPNGGDGWVTESSYALLEADGFRGYATGAAAGAEAFRRGLDSYDPAMGASGRSLILAHHSPHEHVVALVELIGELPVAPAPDAPLRELAQLVRIAYIHQSNSTLVRRSLEQLVMTHRAEIEQISRLRAGEIEALAAANCELAELSAELDRERARHAAELQVLEERLDAISGTRRWQAMNRLLHPLDKIRRR